ncbi:MAG: homocysteine S-methyltransferase family protein [Raoultibacter sp.]
MFDKTKERVLRIKDDYLAEVLAGRAYLLFDGAMGTMLQAAGLEAGETPELLTLGNPDAIRAIHAAYVAAGSQVITTNTFGANTRKLGSVEAVSEVFTAAVRCARETGASYVAADIGPTGSLLKPMGTMTFDEAYDLFTEEVVAASAAGADIILIETMADLLEMKAAVLAAKENCDLPIFATMTFGEDGRTFLGTSPQVAALTLSALGVQVLGVNCSLGPQELIPIVEALCEASTCPVMVQANAGLPKIVAGQTVFDITPLEYGAAVTTMLDGGVSVVGGCCGTNPLYIEELARCIKGRRPTSRVFLSALSVTSSQNAVVLSKDFPAIAVVGERINPTGKKRLQEALRTGNYDYVIAEAINQTEAGADVLDVNVGLPEIDETATLVRLVELLAATTPLPLQIDSSDPAAIEAAVRCYAGKPLINSVNGKAKSMHEVLPLAAHYGCAVVGLTLDEGGIPATADERFAIAEKIVAEAGRYGISAMDVVIDCLTMSASTNQAEVLEILRCIGMVKKRLGCKTMLGVSNVSFGLPQRELVNATFLASALGVGLDIPILNPLAARYRDVVSAFRVLNAQDDHAESFIALQNQ